MAPPDLDTAPAPGSDARGRRAGQLLVALQLLLIAALALGAAPAFMGGRAGGIAWALATAAAGLGLWALRCNRPGNFNIHPAPRVGGQLVQQGPYRGVRHPMHSAVLLGGAACVAAAGAWWALGWPGVMAGPSARLPRSGAAHCDADGRLRAGAGQDRGGPAAAEPAAFRASA